jgi:hypothetical protein
MGLTVGHVEKKITTDLRYNSKSLPSSVGPADRIRQKECVVLSSNTDYCKGEVVPVLF